MKFKFTALLLVVASCIASATAQSAELVCSGELRIYGSDPATAPLSGTHIGISSGTVKVTGAISFIDATYIVWRNDEAGIDFKNGRVEGNLNRFSGDINIFLMDDAASKFEWMYEGVCGLQKPLF